MQYIRKNPRYFVYTGKKISEKNSKYKWDIYLFFSNFVGPITTQIGLPSSCYLLFWKSAGVALKRQSPRLFSFLSSAGYSVTELIIQKLLEWRLSVC